MSFDDTLLNNRISRSVNLGNSEWPPLKQFDEVIPNGMKLSNNEFGNVMYDPYPVCDQIWKQYYT